MNRAEYIAELDRLRLECIEAEVREEEAYVRVNKLRTFAQRVHELCDDHIVCRQAEVDRGKSKHGACGDCVVWTLRAEAAKAVSEGAEDKQ